MAPPHKTGPEKTTNRRHSKDRQLKSKVARYNQLLRVGQIITSEINFEVLFDVIIEQTTNIVSAEQCSIFLLDNTGHYLRAFVSTDLKKDAVRFPKNKGVAGWVFSHRTPVIIDDPYGDQRFYTAIDKKTGFRTKSILCVPLINRKDECIGTLQALNKKAGKFSDEDREILSYVSHYVTIALENSMLYEELKASDCIKQKVINHLSHELKTPIAILSTALNRLSKEFPGNRNRSLQRIIERGQRSVVRLMNVQEKVDDIVNRKAIGQEKQYLRAIEDIAGFFEEIIEEGVAGYDDVIDKLSLRVRSLFQEKTVCMEKIRLATFMDGVCNEVLSFCTERNIQTRTSFQKDLFINMDKNVLTKVFCGLLKNAIENTPDEGIVEVSVSSDDDEIRVIVRDYGVGITSENQKHIFGGFFHTQDSELYSSKRPYQFNAGGTGSDLLRIKAFAERFGFVVDYESRRCRFIPLDSDICPGRISACGHIQDHSECLNSGGSVFWIRFPKVRDF